MIDTSTNDAPSHASPEFAPGGIYRKSIKSGSWYMASVIGQKTLNLVTFFILARLLAPNDYGIITIVMAVVIPLNQLTTISFGDALMQRQGSIEKFLSPLFTFDLLRSSALALLVYAFGSPLAAFFHVTDPSLVLLIKTSGLLLILPACSNIRTIYLYKELEYRKIFYRDIVIQATASVVTVGYAFFVSRSAWALLIGAVAQNVVGVFVSYAIYPVRPSFSFQFRTLVELLGFTKWIYGQEVLDVIIAQIDKIFVGRLMAASQLGIYAKAKDLASTATNTVASMISKIGFAA
ncbi:MAG: oligosaccharide flippase family protein, partial [Patescibacteria group bacterium]